MAKKTARKSTQGSRRRSTRSTTQRSSSSSSGSGNKFFDKLKEIYDNPAARYIAAGLATAALTKAVQSLSTRYPEITNLLKESLDNFEGKLVEFREMSEGTTSTSKPDSQVDEEMSVAH